MANITTTQDYRPFRVRATDAEDLAVVSALLQDAAVPTLDVAYLAQERRFAFVASRYLWEQIGGSPAGAASAPGHRVRCAVVISEVSKVQVRNLDIQDKARVLGLLAIGFDLRTGHADGADNAESQAAELRLIFSGEAEIRVLVERLDLQAEDFGDPWPTLFKPGHPAAADG